MNSEWIDALAVLSTTHAAEFEAVFDEALEPIGATAIPYPFLRVRLRAMSSSAGQSREAHSGGASSDSMMCASAIARAGPVGRRPRTHLGGAVFQARAGCNTARPPVQDHRSASPAPGQIASRFDA